jgi:hypothetical protein
LPRRFAPRNDSESDVRAGVANDGMGSREWGFRLRQ